MKKQVRTAIIVGVAITALLLISSLALGLPGQDGVCSESGCHDSPTGMSMTSSVDSITVQSGQTFSIVISVEGVSGQDALTLKFPADVDDNSEFDYGTLGDEGRVDDGDPVDEDPDTDQVEVNYTIVAPSTPGTYTLHPFAAQHTPHGIDLTISVTVQEPAGPGPSFNWINGTPTIPLSSEPVVVTANVTSDEGIGEVILQYSLDNGASWNNVSMELEGGIYQGTIPAQSNGVLVIYRVVAIDTEGTESVSWENEYTVGDTPVEPIEIPQLHYGWLLGGPALVLAYVGTALEYYDEERFTKIHGVMLGLAYILTTINVLWLFAEDPSVWSVMEPANLFNTANALLFVHCWHVWLGIISMIFGTLAMITHLGGWKTCNLGLPAVLLWTILGFTGMYLGIFYRM